MRKEDTAGMNYVSIGGNLPCDNRTALQLCVAASSSIARMTGVADAVLSPWYSSAPVPPSDQPRFVNGVIRFTFAGDPARLLAALQALERKAGRIRSVPNAARTLDLDLIDSAARLSDDPALTLPHPRAHLREFVLRPLRDVAPNWVHPRLGHTVGALLASLPPADVRLI